jgi:hypothetical protein
LKLRAREREKGEKKQKLLFSQKNIYELATALIRVSLSLAAMMSFHSYAAAQSQLPSSPPSG